MILDLMQKVRVHVDHLEAAVEEVCEIERLDISGRGKIVETDEAIFRGVAAIVATGRKPILLDVPGAAGFVLSVFNLAINFILFSYTAESYPTKMHNTATGFHNGVARLSVSASQPWIPMIFQAYGFVGVFSAVGIFYLLPVVPLLIWGMRTGGKSLEDIEYM